MERFENKTNTIGALLAVIISFVALGHTVWSDRQLRECDFLYNKNERLIELKEKVTQVNNALTNLRLKGRGLIEDPDAEHIREML